jgi:putative membrane protein
MNSSATTTPDSWKTFRLALSLAFLVIWLFLAISPSSRADWVLENALTIVFAAFFLWSWRHFCLSPITLTMIFAFMVLHTIGAHYTYANVPYDVWWQSLTGSTLNSLFGFERNHYDRLVHFCYGLLLAYPAREALVRWAGLYGFWGYFIPLDLTMSTSMIYELIEWGAAEVFGGDLGQTYLGTQGDVWDAHKDMALASIGALITIVAAWLLRDRITGSVERSWSK